MSACRFLVALAVAFAPLGAARADIAYIGDSELPGRFTGSVEVSNQTANSALITVTLTNISPFSNGGYLTAFAFNDPNSSSKGDIGGVTAFTAAYAPATGQSLVLLGGPSFNNSVSSEPFGNFDIGAGVGGSWHSGGSPVDGIAVGETGVFGFLVSGTNLTNLTAAHLMAAPSTKNTAGFVVRFRGFNDNSSDKDVAGVLGNPVPAPPGAVLAGIGSAGLLLGRARRRPVAAA